MSPADVASSTDDGLWRSTICHGHSPRSTVGTHVAAAASFITYYPPDTFWRRLGNKTYRFCQLRVVNGEKRLWILTSRSVYLRYACYWSYGVGYRYNHYFHAWWMTAADYRSGIARRAGHLQECFRCYNVSSKTARKIRYKPIGLDG